MAKKTTAKSSTATATPKPKLNPRDKKTLAEIVGLADGVVTAAEKKRDPHLDIPARSLSNVKYNKQKRFIEMGNAKNRRQLFNLSQAKSYMQTVLVASGCKTLIDQQKTNSIRGLFYQLKHKIDGTGENTFETQDECDPVIEDLRSDPQQPPRRVACVRLESRRHGRPDHAHRRRRRN